MVNTFPLIFAYVAYSETDYHKLAEYDFMGPIYEMDAQARLNCLRQVADIAESEAVTHSSLSIRVAI